MLQNVDDVRDIFPSHQPPCAVLCDAFLGRTGITSPLTPPAQHPHETSL